MRSKDQYDGRDSHHLNDQGIESIKDITTRAQAEDLLIMILRDVLGKEASS